MQRCDNHSTVAEILVGVELGLDEVRSLVQQQLILLTPA